jgi:hypothetical protein
MIFILYLNDDHTDPEFKAFHDLDDAVQAARDVAAECIEQYGDMDYYIYPSDGTYGCWYSACGEERWRVQVWEAELK